jgi:hypothetical protein
MCKYLLMTVMEHGTHHAHPQNILMGDGLYIPYGNNFIIFMHAKHLDNKLSAATIWSERPDYSERWN